MLTVSFCDRNTGTGNRSRSRSTRGSCTGTQIDVTAAHTAGALLTHGAVRSWWAVRCHLPAADAYAYPPKVNISSFTCFVRILRGRVQCNRDRLPWNRGERRILAFPRRFTAILAYAARNFQGKVSLSYLAASIFCWRSYILSSGNIDCSKLLNGCLPH